MRGATLVHVDLEVGPARDHRPGRGGVVEVDVGQQDGARLLVADRFEHGRQRGLGAGVNEGAVDLPAADHVRATEVADVDYAHGAEVMRAG